jgi:streptogramin lyase
VAAGPSGIWVADTSHGTVERLDPERASVATTIGLGVRTSDIAVDRDGVWATDTGEGTLLEVDPVREVVNQSVKVRARSIKVDTFVGAGFPKTVAAGGGSVWADGSPSILTRVVAGHVRSRLRGIDTGISALAFGQGALWVVGENTPEVLRIDPRSERQSSVAVASEGSAAPFLGALAVGAGSVWVTILPPQAGPVRRRSGPDQAREGRSHRPGYGRRHDDDRCRR